MKPRVNVDMAYIVENGLVVDDIAGSAVAWAYLDKHGVPSPVILRVLISKSRRRPFDRPMNTPDPHSMQP